MADFISIGVEGEPPIQAKLRGAARYSEAPIRPVARALEDVVYLAVRGQYSSEGRRGPTGRPWTRKRSTIDRYTAMNRRGFQVLNEPMRRTNALYTSEATRGGPHGILDVGDDYLIMGTDLAYGLIQQKKGQKQYDLTDGDIQDIRRIVNRGVLGNFVDGGFDYKDTAGEIPF